MSRAARTHGAKISLKETGFEGSARAYRTLKLASSQQQAIRQEQRFFRLEMAEEAKGAPRRQRYLYRAYNLLSDYGFSLLHSLLLLVVVWLACSLIYGSLAKLSMCLPLQSGCHISQPWIKFSLLQGLPLSEFDSVGEKLHEDFFGEKVATLGVLVAAFFHKAISLPALFLAGLALRTEYIRAPRSQPANAIQW